jgi:hypothetical protein
MIKKTIEIEVDTTTWPRGVTVPPQLAGVTGSSTLDLGSAFLMLGTLTMPDLLSPASPARFWAWLRYYLAPTVASDLRIAMDFAGLDPHQKGILSDDFGVALSTQWLFDRFGGFRDIVDGRRFMVQFAELLPKKTKPATAKVGPTKAPDFVIKDLAGRWHVLECKGTQSGRAQRDVYLAKALSQKRMIQITGALRGERLAAGLAISNVQSKEATNMRIVDPDDGEPLLELGDQQSDEIDLAAHRLAVAGALGVVGLGEAAIELSLPERTHAGTPFLRRSEAARLRSDRRVRRLRAQQEIQSRRLLPFRLRGLQYEGRSVDFDDLPFNPAVGIRRIRVTQAINHDMIDEIARTDTGTPDDVLASQITRFTGNARIEIVSHGGQVTLTYGDRCSLRRSN